MSELEYLRGVVEARTKGPWKAERVIHAFEGMHERGELCRVEYGHHESVNPRRVGKIDSFTLCDVDSSNFEEDTRFIALAGTIFDDVMRVLEAADAVNRYAGNEDDEERARFHFACYALDKQLASLKAAIRRARGDE